GVSVHVSERLWEPGGNNIKFLVDDTCFESIPPFGDIPRRLRFPKVLMKISLGDHFQAFCALRVPHVNDAIRRGGEHSLAIRRKSNVPHDVLVAAKAGEFGPEFDIPDAHRLIVGSGNDQAAVLREGNAQNQTLVATEAGDGRARWHGPDSDRS